MSQFPNEIYTPRTVENRAGVSYDPSKTKVQFAEDTNKPNAEIVAIETALGTNPAGAYESVKAWLSALASAIGAIVVPTKATGAEINTGTDDSKFVTPKAIADSNVAFMSDIPSVPVKATGAEINTGTDDSKFVTPKAIADSNVAFLSDVSAVLQTVYPVGSIYINANVTTNPATLFGFGTWESFGAGRVLVGQDTGDPDFDTLGEMRGSKTTNVEHNHRTALGFDPWTGYLWGNGNSEPIFGSDVIGNVTGGIFTGGGFQSRAVRVARTDIMSGNSSPSIVQPSIVVKVWRRTA